MSNKKFRTPPASAKATAGRPADTEAGPDTDPSMPTTTAHADNDAPVNEREARAILLRAMRCLDSIVRLGKRAIDAVPPEKISAAVLSDLPDANADQPPANADHRDRPRGRRPAILTIMATTKSAIGLLYRLGSVILPELYGAAKGVARLVSSGKNLVQTIARNNAELNSKIDKAFAQRT